jgi:hypothetical protein
MLLRDADASVAHQEGESRLVAAADEAGDDVDAALFGELDGVADEVHQQLADAVGIGMNGLGDFARPTVVEADALFLRPAVLESHAKGLQRSAALG